MKARRMTLSAIAMASAIATGTPLASLTISVGAAATTSCTTSAKDGSCVFPRNESDFPGVNPGVGRPNSQAVEIDQNVWNADSPDCKGWTQRLSASSPEDFQIVAKYPSGNTAVCTYPNVWPHDALGRVDSYSQTTSSFSESFPHNSATHAWGMFDLWFNHWANEVMIQYDFSENPACPTTPVTDKTFGGSHGVPARKWFLCTFGSPTADGGYTTTAWKLGANQARKQSESSGSIDILAMIKFLEKKGYLPAHSKWTAISMGWEICSTGNRTETFTGSGFTVRMVHKEAPA